MSFIATTHLKNLGQVKKKAVKVNLERAGKSLATNKGNWQQVKKRTAQVWELLELILSKSSVQNFVSVNLEAGVVLGGLSMSSALEFLVKEEICWLELSLFVLMPL